MVLWQKYISGKSSQEPLQFVPVDVLLLLLLVCVGVLLEVLVSPVVVLLLVDIKQMRAVKHELAVATPKWENIGSSNPRIEIIWKLLSWLLFPLIILRNDPLFHWKPSRMKIKGKLWVRFIFLDKSCVGFRLADGMVTFQHVTWVCKSKLCFDSLSSKTQTYGGKGRTVVHTWHMNLTPSAELSSCDDQISALQERPACKQRTRNPLNLNPLQNPTHHKSYQIPQTLDPVNEVTASLCQIVTRRKKNN